MLTTRDLEQVTHWTWGLDDLCFAAPAQGWPPPRCWARGRSPRKPHGVVLLSDLHQKHSVLPARPQLACGFPSGDCAALRSRSSACPLPWAPREGPGVCRDRPRLAQGPTHVHGARGWLGEGAGDPEPQGRESRSGKMAVPAPPTEYSESSAQSCC